VHAFRRVRRPQDKHRAEPRTQRRNSRRLRVWFDRRSEKLTRNAVVNRTTQTEQPTQRPQRLGIDGIVEFQADAEAVVAAPGVADDVDLRILAKFARKSWAKPGKWGENWPKNAGTSRL
jgi:hypothetical protein